MKRKNSTVKVTRADGTTYEIPPYDRQSLKIVREGGRLTDNDRAVITVTCSVCGSRPGRRCRTKTGRIVHHVARTIAYRNLRAGSEDSRPIGSTQ